MHAMVLNKIGAPLQWTELPDCLPGPGQVRVKIAACGVCRTDLHVVDGELAHPRVPIIPGHEIIGLIDAVGSGVDELHEGQRVGIPCWATPVEPALIARCIAKISAIIRYSRATRATAGSRPRPSPMRASRSRLAISAATFRWHLCYARG